MINKIVLLNFFGIAIVFLELLHFANLNIAIGISLIVIAIAITGFIIAEIKEETKFLKDFLEAIKKGE